MVNITRRLSFFFTIEVVVIVVVVFMVLKNLAVVETVVVI